MEDSSPETSLEFGENKSQQSHQNVGTTPTREIGAEGSPGTAVGAERGTTTIEDTEKGTTIRERKETSRERIQECTEICQGTKHWQAEIDSQDHVEEAIEAGQEDENELQDGCFGIRLCVCQIVYAIEKLGFPLETYYGPAI